jgi:hypothetical protein
MAGRLPGMGSARGCIPSPGLPGLAAIGPKGHGIPVVWPVAWRETPDARRCRLEDVPFVDEGRIVTSAG